jgi:hypothetical protein
MFEVYCPAHRSRVLLTSRRITALHSGHDGVLVEWQCWCGHHGFSAHGLTGVAVVDPAADAA